jgi:hypothetical protein
LTEDIQFKSFSKIEQDLEELPLQIGGRFSSNQKNSPKIAIIIPYRNRERNLKMFIYYMHHFLSSQTIDYTIYVIEPIEELTFNKGIAMNAGFMESLRNGEKYDCYIFHDVDLLPESNRNIYSCDTSAPKLLAVTSSVYNYS